MALVTSIVMKFTLVYFGFGEIPHSNSFSAFIWRDFSSLCTALHILVWSSRPVKTYQSCWLPLLGDFSQSTIVLTSVKGEPVLRIYMNKSYLIGWISDLQQIVELCGHERMLYYSRILFFIWWILKIISLSTAHWSSTSDNKNERLVINNVWLFIFRQIKVTQ